MLFRIGDEAFELARFNLWPGDGDKRKARDQQCDVAKQTHKLLSARTIGAQRIAEVESVNEKPWQPSVAAKYLGRRLFAAIEAKSGHRLPLPTVSPRRGGLKPTLSR